MKMKSSSANINAMAILACAVSFLLACGDDEAPGFDQSAILGKWKLTESTVYDLESGTCTSYEKGYDITSDKILLYGICDGDENTVGPIDYSYAGNVLTYSVFGTTYRHGIQTVTGTTMSWTESWNGEDKGTGSLQKIP